MVPGKNLISTTLLMCIMVICIFYILYWLLNKFIKIELFSNSNSNNDKRYKMMKIYKDDDIYDPDENTNDECTDPDASCGKDPDS